MMVLAISFPVAFSMPSKPGEELTSKIKGPLALCKRSTPATPRRMAFAALMAAISVVLVVAVSACGDDSGNGMPAGEVSATLDGATYTLPADCSEREGEINLYSADDGSGIEIAARQMGEKLNLDIFVGEKEYSTPNLDQWQRTDEGLSGSGRLWLDDAEDYREYPVTFNASCG